MVLPSLALSTPRPVPSYTHHGTSMPVEVLIEGVSANTHGDKEATKTPIIPPPVLFPQNSKIVFAERWDLHNFSLANPPVGQALPQSAGILYSR